MYKNPQAIFEDLLLKFNDDYSNIKIITEARLYSQKEWYMASFYIIRKNNPNITVWIPPLYRKLLRLEYY